MKSRKLTSDFDVWSRGHLRMAVMHLLAKFGANCSIQFGVRLLTFSEIQDGRHPPYCIYYEAMGPPTKAHS